jgi:hypothetical protein
MHSRASGSFWACFQELSEEIQRSTTKQYRLWLRDVKHPSVQFKRVQNYWSARITDNYRALGIADGDTVVWFWIGNHSEYERLIKRKR